MRSYNHVVLVGNVVRDPELRSLQNGTSVATLSLAVSESRKDADGNWIEDTSYFDVTVWGRSAEVVNSYAKKGSPVLVSGRLKQDTWEQDGQRRSKVKIVADTVNLLTFGGGNGNGSGSGSGYQKNGNSSGYRNGNNGRWNNGNGGGYRSNNGNNGGSYAPAQPQSSAAVFDDVDPNIPF